MRVPVATIVGVPKSPAGYPLTAADVDENIPIGAVVAWLILFIVLYWLARYCIKCYKRPGRVGPQAGAQPNGNANGNGAAPPVVANGTDNGAATLVGGNGNDNDNDNGAAPLVVANGSDNGTANAMAPATALPPVGGVNGDGDGAIVDLDMIAGDQPPHQRPRPGGFLPPINGH